MNMSNSNNGRYKEQKYHNTHTIHAMQASHNYGNNQISSAGKVLISSSYIKENSSLAHIKYIYIEIYV